MPLMDNYMPPISQSARQCGDAKYAAFKDQIIDLSVFAHIRCREFEADENKGALYLHRIEFYTEEGYKDKSMHNPPAAKIWVWFASAEEMQKAFDKICELLNAAKL